MHSGPPAIVLQPTLTLGAYRPSFCCRRMSGERFGLTSSSASRRPKNMPDPLKHETASSRSDHGLPIGGKPCLR